MGLPKIDHVQDDDLNMINLYYSLYWKEVFFITLILRLPPFSMGFSGGHRLLMGDSKGYTEAEVAVDLATTLLAPQDRPGARWIPGAAMQHAMFIGGSDSNSFGRFFRPKFQGISPQFIWPKICYSQ